MLKVVGENRGIHEEKK